MATYKVIQDIEAEDKLVGPFSLRQFIYAAIVLVLGFVGYQLAKANFLLAIPFLPPMMFFGALAAPISGVQSSEIWLLAKIRFFIKPRIRIWNQDGIRELVTITVPKKEEKQLTDNLSQHEVKSRLSALANTLDSRGWAVRGAADQTAQNPIMGNSSDRLVAVNGSLPSPDTDDTEDIMDESSGQVAKQMQSLLDQSTQQYKKHISDQIRNPAAPQPANDYWFMNGNPNDPKGEQTKTILPGASAQQTPDDRGSEEQAFLEKRRNEKQQPNLYAGNLKTLNPIGEQNQQKAAPPKPKNQNIARLASNDDLNISTIAREAERTIGSEGEDGEVVINLH